MNEIPDIVKQLRESEMDNKIPSIVIELREMEKSGKLNRCQIEQIDDNCNTT